MADVIDINGGIVSVRLAKNGCFCDPADVIDGVPRDAVEEIVVVARMNDGTMYLAGSHGYADTSFLLSQASVKVNRPPGDYDVERSSDM